jgi:hypothetical protein
MTCFDGTSTDLEVLRSLARLTPDSDRARRVRRRCRTRLSRRRIDRRASQQPWASRHVPPLMVAGFCLFYVVVLVATTLQFQASFR